MNISKRLWALLLCLCMLASLAVTPAYAAPATNASMTVSKTEVNVGDTITVTGLITARDLIAQLSDKSLGSELLISSSMLRSCSEVFLDDLTVNDVEESLKTVVRAVGNDGYELLDAIMGTGC